MICNFFLSLPPCCGLRRAGSALTAAALALAVPAAMSAQNAPANPKSPAAIQRAAARDAARAAEIEAALALAAEGHVAQAETRVLRGIAHHPQSPQAALEAASRLGHLSLTLQQRGFAEPARTLAFRAAAALADVNAKQLADATPHVRAQVWQALGLIQERMLFDDAAARAAYLRAQQEHPEAPGAKAGLRRLDEDEAKRARVVPTKG